MQPLCRFAAILAALALPAIAAAETVYKWTDDDGLTHYTQQPPLGRAAERLEPHRASGPPRRVGPVPAQTAGTGDDDGESQSDSPDSVAEYCEQMREQAETLASDQVLSVRREGGELQALEGEDRAERLTRTREQITRHCANDSA